MVPQKIGGHHPSPAASRQAAPFSELFPSPENFEGQIIPTPDWWSHRLIQGTIGCQRLCYSHQYHIGSHHLRWKVVAVGSWFSCWRNLMQQTKGCRNNSVWWQNVSKYYHTAPGSSRVQYSQMLLDNAIWYIIRMYMCYDVCGVHVSWQWAELANSREPPNFQ